MQLDYFRQQNIIWLTKKIANNINLIKSLFHSIYVPYFINNL